MIKELEKMAKRPVNIKQMTLSALILLSMACNLTGQVPATPTHLPTPVRSETAAPKATNSLPVTATPNPTFTLAPTEASLAPTYIPPGCQGTPVATTSPTQFANLPTPELHANPTISKEEQIKVFEALVSRISQVYLYPDYNGLDWTALVAQTRVKVQSGVDTETFYTEMEKSVYALKDDYSNFESPAMVAKANAELSGVTDFVGVGVRVNPVSDQVHATILSVFPDSPAEHSGLKPHDRILLADGLPIVEKGIVHTGSRFICRPRWLR